MPDKATATNTPRTLPRQPIPSATSPYSEDSSNEELSDDPEPPYTSRNTTLSKKEIAAARKRLREAANRPSWLAALNPAMIALTGLDWGLRPDPDPTADRFIPTFDPLTLGEPPARRKARMSALGTGTVNRGGSGSGSGERKLVVDDCEAGVAGSAGGEENRGCA
ncbi:hypothetical protein EHS25_008410 [Saitozyma podzolica]|uniref:Uncharacterized protein n=1 Tax=Saitozyma podzolica TaxID=1890683 RepID=A0A427YPC9_9TREE|nr:hypothetical protein EHS25_008410 [Saitozyma podzolica]